MNAQFVNRQATRMKSTVGTSNNISWQTCNTVVHEPAPLKRDGIQYQKGLALELTLCVLPPTLSNFLWFCVNEYLYRGTCGCEKSPSLGLSDSRSCYLSFEEGMDLQQALIF